MKSSNRQCISYVSPVPATARQGTETGSWVEASIWTERMLAALENGVKGGKWFSLIDKVSRLRTLEIAWQKVKTHVGDCSAPGQGFEFLGYRFEAGKRWVRKKSLKSLRERIRIRTKRTRGDSIEHIIESLNPMLRGWFIYFKHANPYVFKSTDGYVRRRLRAILRKQQKRPGMGHTHKDHQRWPNAYFAGHGLFTMSEAHALACRSRC